VQSYKPTRFYYLRADASVLGGHLQTPVEKVVPTLAPVSLPPVGGLTLARGEEFTLDEILTLASHYSRVSSEEDATAGVSTILITTAVENLNILEVFTADRIVTQLTISVPIEGGPIGVSTVGSTFEGVHIAGFPCTVRLKTSLQPLGRTPGGRSNSLTWSDVFETGRTQAQAQLNSFQGRNESDVTAWAQKRYGWMTSAPGAAGNALCSIVESLETDAPVQIHGNIVEIPHFGRIALGELVVDPRHAQLLGVRADLGCAVQGRITAMAGGGGGTGDN